MNDGTNHGIFLEVFTIVYALIVILFLVVAAWYFWLIKKRFLQKIFDDTKKRNSKEYREPDYIHRSEQKFVPPEKRGQK